MTTQISSTEESHSLYERDFYLWIEITAKLLRHRELEQLDYDNLIEEIEAMGRKEKHAIESNLVVVLMHLLKYKYQSQKRSNSWRYTIIEHRNRIKRILRDSPSLQRYPSEVFDDCYQDARREAEAETGLSLDSFPLESPFTVEETLNPDYLPD